MRNKDKFEFFRIGMVTGLIEKEEVINWADRELLSSDKPDHEVIEVALAGRLPYSQIIFLLNTFQGNPDHDVPVKMVLAYALFKTRDNIDKTKEIIQGIRLIKAEYGIDRHIVKGLTALEEGLESVRNGKIKIEELHQNLISFLMEYSDYQEKVNQLFSN
jgi:hypothetical protein